MAGDLVSLSYLTTNLASGRNPTVPSGAAPMALEDITLTDTSGVVIAGSMALFVLSALRLDPMRRTSYIDVTTLDLTEDYTATIDGTDVTVTGPFTDRAELLSEWAAAINADATAGAKVTADSFASYSSGNAVLRIRGKTGTAYHKLNPTIYSIAASATGSAAVSVYADAEAATVSLFWKPLHTPTGGAVTDAANRSVAWRAIAAPTTTGKAVYTLDGDGYAFRIDCSGAQRIAAIVSNVSGHASDAVDQYLVSVDLTPCTLESSS